MKLSDVLIENMKKLSQDFHVFYNHHGLIGFGGDGIHLDSETFLDTFEYYSTFDTGSPDYPERLEIQVEGTTFYCLRKKLASQ